MNQEQQSIIGTKILFGNKYTLVGTLYLFQLGSILQFLLTSIRNITMQDRNNIHKSNFFYICTYDSINIVIPSNDLKKWYIRFIKLGFYFIKLRTFFDQIGKHFCLKISEGRGRYRPPPHGKPAMDMKIFLSIIFILYISYAPPPPLKI